jgi:hypothetical protein
MQVLHSGSTPGVTNIHASAENFMRLLRNGQASPMCNGQRAEGGSGIKSAYRDARDEGIPASFRHCITRACQLVQVSHV